MDDKAMQNYAITYHCGEEWGEEMLQSVDLGHAVEAAHALIMRVWGCGIVRTPVAE